MDFRTSCGQLALPYFEDFESYPSGSSEFPPCWSSLAGSPHTYSGGSSFGESGNSLKFSGHNDTLATPFVPHNVDDLQLSFQLKREGNSSGSILVGFTTSLSNMAVIDTIAVISPTDNLYHYYEFNLNQYNLSGQGYFVFKQSGYNNYWYWMDNVRIQPVPNCLAPANLTVSDVTSSSVTLAWDAAAMANNYRVVFGTGNFNPDTVSVNVEHTSDTIATLQGLSDATQYYAYVRTNCGGGETSLWSDPIPFRTSCQERPIPYYEDFDTFSSGETPICWNDLSQGSSYARVSTTDSLYAPTSLYILQYNSEYLI